LLTLMLPLSAQADGGEHESIQTVNGYQVTLSFVEEPGMGDNQVHIQIQDAMAMPVTDATVEVMVMPLQEDGHTEEAEAESHDSLADQDADQVETSESSHENMSGADQPAPESTEEHDEGQIFLLEPAHEQGEYAGEITIPSAGDWTLAVHLTVQDEAMELEFPFIVKNNAKSRILMGFAGVNFMVLLVAAIQRSKRTSK
jgi:hypothetical protein